MQGCTTAPGVQLEALQLRLPDECSPVNCMQLLRPSRGAAAVRDAGEVAVGEEAGCFCERVCAVLKSCDRCNAPQDEDVPLTVRCGSCLLLSGCHKPAEGLLWKNILLEVLRFRDVAAAPFEIVADAFGRPAPLFEMFSTLFVCIFFLYYGKVMSAQHVTGHKPGKTNDFYTRSLLTVPASWLPFT